MNYCPNCGKRLSETENYCSNCGRSLKKKRGKKKLFIFFVIPFLVIAIVLIIFKFYLPSFAKHNLEVNTPGESSFSSFSDDSAAINKAAESVVKITGYNPQGIACVTGSGFALFEGGIIVSNYHVIEPGIVRLTAETEQGNSFECSGIIGLDKDKDIVILKTDNCAGLNPLEAGSSNNLQKGDKVVAIGSPLGLKNSVSTGVFSGYLLEPEGTVLQFTAAISSGSSGGALFDDAGRVIGITYASYSDGQSLNLAIPIENVEELFNRTNGKIKPMTLLEYYNEIYVPNHNTETFPNIDNFVYQSNLFREIGFSEEEIDNAIVYGYRISKSFQQSSISEEEIVEQIEIAGQIGISAERALQLIEEGYRFSYVGLATVIKDK